MAVVEVDCRNLKNNPKCPHGPTLKFVKIDKDQKQEFYACSTYRDRKDCSFYLRVGDKLTDKIKQVWDQERNKLPVVNHELLEERLQEVRNVLPKERLYCHSCSELDLATRRANHQSHQVQTVISDTILSHPSKILRTKEGNKKEAQYLFSPISTKVIVDNLQRAEVSRVLCIGTPRIHEHIQSMNSGMESLLLDTDHRYHSFWPCDKFVWFNMFNRHFYSSSPEPKRVLRKFLSGCDRGALVIDPPFGGHVDPLTATIKHFSKLYSKKNPENDLKVLWIFPYFRERHVTQKLPHLKMLDYKVEYDNHKDYSSKRKLGSPARLFTNLDPSQFVLPESEGYRFCQPCSKWVSPENNHCKKCNACTSKNGRTYKHCDECRRCVKPRWQHCNTCRDCLPVDHICGSQVLHSPNENIEPRHKRIRKMKMLMKSKAENFI
ncbi:rRNA N6-adenosine-methyltransferase ZCCHC4-like [Macrosteles quadrilineatus]|uniref:rRNA N6-adenosine-methyltransferase ZCCHC4-like n=1 Tax=Macrosteles quadrilineatus TaxID=74068 RepID=UPI0023E256CD|nr:rRNA N6-adenosine-methyltransferase ZCCHC4-like [Macrosteles quadrilineatus]